MMLEPLLQQTAQALDTIAKEQLPLLSISGDWQSKYRVLMQLGKQLPDVASLIRHDEFAVTGCESSAWLMHYHDKTQDKHYFVLDSEARIVKGLMAIMLCFINGKTTDELKNYNLEHEFNQLQLKAYLSQSRGNGLNAMLDKIKLLVSSSY